MAAPPSSDGTPSARSASGSTATARAVDQSLVEGFERPCVCPVRRDGGTTMRCRNRKGRAMTDELQLVHKADLEGRRAMLSPNTMAAIDSALRDVLARH